VSPHREEELDVGSYLLDYPSTLILIQLLSKNRLKAIGNKMAMYLGISNTIEI
jgi:hypothetical protein